MRLGMMVDRWAGNGRVFKLVQGLGFLFLAACFAMIGVRWVYVRERVCVCVPGRLLRHDRGKVGVCERE